MRIEVFTSGAGEVRLIRSLKVPKEQRSRMLTEIQNFKARLEDSRFETIRLQIGADQIEGLLDSVDTAVDHQGETVIRFTLLSGVST